MDHLLEWVYGRRDGGQYMKVALALSLLALHAPPPTSVTVVQQRCPDGSGADVQGCADVARGIVYVDPLLKREGSWPWRFALAHELGHVWDYQHLDDATRQRFAQLIGQPGADWQTGDGAPPSPYVFGNPAPIEVFADAYAFCAMGPRYRRWSRGHGRNYVGPFYLEVIPARVVAVTCWLLRHPPA